MLLSNCFRSVLLKKKKNRCFRFKGGDYTHSFQCSVVPVLYLNHVFGFNSGHIFVIWYTYGLPILHVYLYNFLVELIFSGFTNVTNIIGTAVRIDFKLK